MKEQLIFDPNVTDYKDAHDIAGVILIDKDADVITSGDGDSDDIVNTDINGYDTRAFGYAYDGTNWDRLRMTSGALDVNLANGSINISPESVHIEDDAHASGDEGSFGLTIRIDDITADNSALLAGTNGDYQGSFTNDKGEMYTKDTDVLAQLVAGITVSATDLDIRDLSAATDSVESWIKDSNGDDLQAYNDDLRVADIVNTLANSALTNIGTGAGPGPGAQAIDGGSPLANRKWAWLFNNSKDTMYVGASGITSSTGFPFPPRSMYEFRLGAAAVMHVLGTKASDDQDLRLMEGAA